jgi:hypothetical protein
LSISLKQTPFDLQGLKEQGLYVVVAVVVVVVVVKVVL